MKFTFLRFAFVTLSLVLSCTVSSTFSLGQNIKDEPFIALSDSSGEETSRETYTIASKIKNSGERLFVISRPGKGETARGIAFLRLSYSRAFFDVNGFPFQTAIFAIGDRVDGEGRMEFYLGSHLQLVILAKPNKIPNLSCCPDYTPPVKRKLRRKKSRN